MYQHIKCMSYIDLNSKVLVSSSAMCIR